MLTHDFLEVHQLPYNYDQRVKSLWGKEGKKFLKELAAMLGARAVKVNRNPSGSIDRGYVSGFLEKDGRFVYISISDSCVVRGNEILYRTAKSSNDYTGGANHTASLTRKGVSDLAKNIQNLLKGED